MLFFSILLVVISLQASAVKAATPTTIVCGTATTGATAIPFGGLQIGLPYQQICGPSLLPDGNTMLTNIGFTSNPAIATGLWHGNVTITVGQSWYATANMALNLGSKPQVVYNGPISALLTGQPGDLNFVLMKKPFICNPKNGFLVVQIVAWEADNSGFFVDFSSDVYRVYTPLGSAGTVLENAGMNMIIQGNPQNGK